MNDQTSRVLPNHMTTIVEIAQISSVQSTTFLMAKNKIDVFSNNFHLFNKQLS